MEDWIDYYDSTHTIYVSRTHRDAHFRTIARDIAGYIPTPEAVVLDYSCGEALSANEVAAGCSELILTEPAPNLRARVAARFKANPKIRVLSLREIDDLANGSVDLAVINSVAQYMTPAELDAALIAMHRVLKPGGRLLLGDILQPDVGALRDAWALLRFGARHGFLIDTVIGLVRTALSDYRRLRQSVGLQRYSEAAIIDRLRAAGFDPRRAPANIGYNSARMTFLATR
ncbi:MAG: class I SAM-dependent methyltransferase [Rhizobiales bacterium]|nr:class I SAM-dependent methyltransferase [Hyphomicrobiales bacterium]